MHSYDPKWFRMKYGSLLRSIVSRANRRKRSRRSSAVCDADANPPAPTFEPPRPSNDIFFCAMRETDDDDRDYMFFFFFFFFFFFSLTRKVSNRIGQRENQRRNLCAAFETRDERRRTLRAHNTAYHDAPRASNQTDVIIVAPKRLYIYIYICVCVCVCIYIAPSSTTKKFWRVLPNKEKGAKKRSSFLSLSLNETLNINPTLFFCFALLSTLFFLYYKNTRPENARE